MMSVPGMAVAAARLRELLTMDELALLDSDAGGSGPQGPVTPGLREVSLMSISQTAWEARLQETAELQGQLLVIFEACANLTRPAPRTRRDTFLLGHLWWRPLHTLFCAVGSDLPQYEAVVRGAVDREQSLGTRIEAPQDIRQSGLELAAQSGPADQTRRTRSRTSPVTH